MEGQKLTRTHSSLLRSSPTVRSSIHSISSIAEEGGSQEKEWGFSQELGEKEEKQRRKPPKKSRSTPRTGSNRFLKPGPAMAALSFFSLLSFLFLFSYMRREEILTSENLLLALIFLAFALFFASKNLALINQALTTFKQILEVSTKRLGLEFFPRKRSKSVQWFIGESAPCRSTRKGKRVAKEGVEFYTNGDFYEGEFHKRKCNGSGVYYYFANGRYEGDWVDGRYDGHGIESWARGSKYKGQYRQGLRHGYGVYRFYTGDSYAGEWCNGQSHGFGVQTCADGSCYVGEFKCGIKHGLGCYNFRNGDRYAGEYFGDKIHGFGVYGFANGHSYEGAWHEGRKQGYGMYIFRSGERKCGEWDSGHLETPLPPFSEAVLRAVQGARRTAEKAIYLRRVDEHVSKAVAAANRAAHAARVAAIKAVQNQMDGNVCDKEGSRES